MRKGACRHVLLISASPVLCIIVAQQMFIKLMKVLKKKDKMSRGKMITNIKNIREAINLDNLMLK